MLHKPRRRRSLLRIAGQGKKSTFPSSKALDCFYGFFSAFFPSFHFKSLQVRNIFASHGHSWRRSRLLLSAPRVFLMRTHTSEGRTKNVKQKARKRCRKKDYKKPVSTSSEENQENRKKIISFDKHSHIHTQAAQRRKSSFKVEEIVLYVSNTLMLIIYSFSLPAAFGSRANGGISKFPVPMPLYPWHKRCLVQKDIPWRDGEKIEIIARAFGVARCRGGDWRCHSTLRLLLHWLCFFIGKGRLRKISRQVSLHRCSNKLNQKCQNIDSTRGSIGRFVRRSCPTGVTSCWIRFPALARKSESLLGKARTHRRSRHLERICGTTEDVFVVLGFARSFLGEGKKARQEKKIQ